MNSGWTRGAATKKIAEMLGFYLQGDEWDPIAERIVDVLSEPPQVEGFFRSATNPLNVVAPPSEPAEHSWFSQAALDVTAERRRQVEQEDWTPDHDDLHVDGEIAAAAACYVLHGSGWENKIISPLSLVWPWSLAWWKPKNRRRDLIRATAMLVAEIERLDRKSAAKDSTR